MDRTVEEIALVPGVTQKPDDEALKERKLGCRSNDIENQSRKHQVFIR
jgi:hypothetical protein